MLKLSANADLKELEKFGFKVFGGCAYKRYYNKWSIHVYVNKKNTRICTRGHGTALNKLIDDLVKANIFIDSRKSRNK